MTNKQLEKLVNELQLEVAELKAYMMRNKETQDLNKVRPADGTEPEHRESNLQMKHPHRIQSMRNAIKILPPNLKNEFGRQSLTNVERIVGFKVTEDMMDEAYQGL